MCFRKQEHAWKLLLTIGALGVTYDISPTKLVPCQLDQVLHLEQGDWDTVIVNQSKMNLGEEEPRSFQDKDPGPIIGNVS